MFCALAFAGCILEGNTEVHHITVNCVGTEDTVLVVDSLGNYSNEICRDSVGVDPRPPKP